jgi:SAM-dependent methyltransferase
MSEAESFQEFERRGWSDAEISAEYHARFAALTTQSVAPLLDAVGVARDQRLLDVATGAGYVAAAATERGARAVGIDFSASQVALAKRHYPALEFRQGDAGALPFPDGAFDAVVSNFGMPHFPDGDAFLGEAYRVLRRGGRIAFSAWTPPEECIGFGIIYGAVHKHGRADVALPPGPSFFLYGDAAQSERSLKAAGFRSVKIRKAPLVWRMTSPDVPFETAMHATVRAAALLRAQTPETLAAIRTAIRGAVSAYAQNGTIELPMPAMIAAAEKP